MAAWSPAGQQYVSLASAAVFIDEELDARRNLLRTMADSLAASGALPVTTSIGIAIFLEGALTPAHLLDLADQAMYAAKGQGRDGVALLEAA
ncbi:diguanylate cyclase domain-containing protein [Janthinobacterium sp. LB3P118]|uniref:diguanylate cyclase domain-containing protein n=1 Tax=Janthinobacterium sp. LB3P118 TaxID=3424195 RepID=UPI003F1F8745